MSLNFYLKHPISTKCPSVSRDVPESTVGVIVNGHFVIAVINISTLRTKEKRSKKENHYYYYCLIDKYLNTNLKVGLLDQQRLFSHSIPYLNFPYF